MKNSIVATFIVFLLASCTAHVTPPSGLAAPVSVYVLDHGRHSSLVVPGESGWRRYAYGDWQWYAENRTGVMQGAAALFWPTQAGLGRQLLAQPPDLAPSLTVGFVSLHEIRVEAEQAAALVERLDALHDRERVRRGVNSTYQLEFVEHPQPYWLFSQSNGMVASWLREMDCEISRGPLRASWEIAETHSSD